MRVGCRWIILVCLIVGSCRNAPPGDVAETEAVLWESGQLHATGEQARASLESLKKRLGPSFGLIAPRRQAEMYWAVGSIYFVESRYAEAAHWLRCSALAYRSEDREDYAWAAYAAALSRERVLLEQFRAAIPESRDWDVYYRWLEVVAGIRDIPSGTPASAHATDADAVPYFTAFVAAQCYARSGNRSIATTLMRKAAEKRRANPNVHAHFMLCAAELAASADNMPLAMAYLDAGTKAVRGGQQWQFMRFYEEQLNALRDRLIASTRPAAG